jgi:chemotaxis protein methyltransferase CheR
METETYSLVKSSIKKILDIDLTFYKDEQMKRRLDSWLARSRSTTWPDYFQLVNNSSEERDRFRNYLTINVTEFFRDPDRWNLLRRDVLPDLLKEAGRGLEPRKGLNVWSSGCSIGVEAYTLTILLDEVAPQLNHTLLATDIDRGALAKARARGPYTQDEIRNLTPEQRERYMDLGQGNYVKAKYASRVTFREQNMLQDRFDNGFDLIICRNVVIYFTNDAKQLLYNKFHAALRPGGVLFIGGTEIIPRPTDIGFRNFGISFYMKQS